MSNTRGSVQPTQRSLVGGEPTPRTWDPVAEDSARGAGAATGLLHRL